MWGLSLAVSPGVADVSQSRDEIIEAAGFFRDAFARLEAGPAWLTLNLSCPNTEDDPHGSQSAELARELTEVRDRSGEVRREIEQLERRPAAPDDVDARGGPADRRGSDAVRRLLLDDRRARG